ncbi:MAG: hypothetical protein GY811_23775, partial [Myxococcales bacterium]|nr:hypothetical protein [Myxococcales bacterium]
MKSEQLAAVFSEACGITLEGEAERERLGAALSHALIEARDQYDTVAVDDEDFS